MLFYGFAALPQRPAMATARERAEAAAAASAPAESWVWVLDEKEGYVEAKVLESKPDGGKVVSLNGSAVAKKRAELGEPILALQELAEDFPDMVRMGEVNEATILRAVRVRFLKERIYTNIGSILVAMNPFKRIDIYGPEVVARYLAVGSGEDSEPHAFQIASAAYRGVRGEARDQAIIISGESGAGKTEATKHCLAFFAEAAGSSGGNMQDKLIKANPVLEAFGNAKTVRNNNSSRFGKFMEVHFNGRAQICGCRIINYLLEKSRIVTQTPLERNYHIFYQLPVASDAALLARLRLTRAPADYGYTRASCISVEGLDDAEEFSDVLRSFAVLEFAPGEYEPLFAVVAGLLHLSNVEFVAGGGGGGEDTCAPSDAPASRAGLENAAVVLGMEAGALGRGLSERLLIAGGKRVYSHLSAASARSARDSLAKALYTRLFGWLVARVNAAMAGGLGASRNLVGVLDIFGFEIFAHNTFEQLCINFCNEKLQQHFNTNVFKLEIKTYQAEGITYDEVQFVDNQDVLDLIEARPKGLLVLLDDECKVPRGSDKGFLEKCKAAHAANPRFLKAYKGSKPDEFAVKHYAGEVVYSSESFLEKNKDDLLLNIVELCSSSSVGFIRGLFREEGGGGGGGGGGGSVSGGGGGGSVSGGGGAAVKLTQSQAFRGQLDELMATLNKTEPHYIRCVKSNTAKRPLVYEAEICLQQLRYAGVFEAVRVRQLGFPFRYRHAAFFMRYRCCAANARRFLAHLPKDKTGVDWRAQCLELVADIGSGGSAGSSGGAKGAGAAAAAAPAGAATTDALAPAKFKVGKTMLLYRAEQHRRLERLREAMRLYSAVRIAACWRGKAGRALARALRALRAEQRAAIAARELPRARAALAAGAAARRTFAETRALAALAAQLEAEAGARAEAEGVLARPQGSDKRCAELAGVVERFKALSASAAAGAPGLGEGALLTGSELYRRVVARLAGEERRKAERAAAAAAAAAARAAGGAAGAASAAAGAGKGAEEEGEGEEEGGAPPPPKPERKLEYDWRSAAVTGGGEGLVGGGSAGAGGAGGEGVVGAQRVPYFESYVKDLARRRRAAAEAAAAEAARAVVDMCAPGSGSSSGSGAGAREWRQQGVGVALPTGWEAQWDASTGTPVFVRSGGGAGGSAGGAGGAGGSSGSDPGSSRSESGAGAGAGAGAGERERVYTVAALAERARLPLACLEQALPAEMPPLPAGWRALVSRTTGMPYFVGPGGAAVVDPLAVPGWLGAARAEAAAAAAAAAAAGGGAQAGVALPAGWRRMVSRRTGLEYFVGPGGESAASARDIPRAAAQQQQQRGRAPQ